MNYNTITHRGLKNRGRILPLIFSLTKIINSLESVLRFKIANENLWVAGRPLQNGFCRGLWTCVRSPKDCPIQRRPACLLVCRGREGQIGFF